MLVCIFKVSIFKCRVLKNKTNIKTYEFFKFNNKNMFFKFPVHGIMVPWMGDLKTSQP